MEIALAVLAIVGFVFSAVRFGMSMYDKYKAGKNSNQKEEKTDGGKENIQTKDKQKTDEEVDTIGPQHRHEEHKDVGKFTHKIVEAEHHNLEHPEEADQSRGG